MKYCYLKNVMGVCLLVGLTLAGEAQPCLSGWTYRVPVTINNAGNPSSLTDHQVEVILNTQQLIVEGKMKINAGDIRFLGEDGTVLNYWADPETVNTTTTSLWVKVPDIAAGTTTTIYLFYGRSDAAFVSSGTGTFELFDEFDDTGLDLSTWTFCGTGSEAVSGGNLELDATGGKAVITSQQTFAQSVTVEVDMVNELDDFSIGIFYLGLINSATDDGYGLALEEDALATTMRMLLLEDGTCYDLSDEQPPFSPLPQPAAETDGVWGFSWPANAEQHLTWPGPDSPIDRANDVHAPGTNARVVMGNGSISGEVNVDWLRVRKYTDVQPPVSLGTESASVYEAEAFNDGPVCEGDDLQLTATAVAGAEYTWTGPNGFTSSDQNPLIENVTPSEAGTYDLVVSIPSGCASQAVSTEVEVSPATNAGTLAGAAEVCKGTNAGTVTLSGQTGDVISWETSATGDEPWATINSTATSLNYVNLLSSTYYRAIVRSGVCSSEPSNSILITVNEPTLGGNISGTDEVCYGNNEGTLRLNNHRGEVIKWQSSTNGGTTWIDVANTTTTHSFMDLTTTTHYRVQVQNEVCNAEFSDAFEVTVNPLPVSAFSSTTVCNSTPTVFTNQSAVTGSTIQSFTWDFGEGNSSVSVNPTYTFEDPGTYEVELISVTTSGCSDTVSHPVTVHPLPVVAFQSADVCDGYPSVFVNSTAILTGSISGYQWDFGDGTGSVETSPTKQYYNPGTYLVTLTAESDQQCEVTLSKNVTVDEPPIASFTFEDQCVNSPAQFENASRYDAGTMSFSWSFGDGGTSIATSPDHTYSSPGLFPVRLVVTTNEGCVDSVTQFIRIIDLEASVQASQDTVTSKGFPVPISAMGGVSYVWEPAEGLNDANIADPIAAPLVTTTYSVTAIDERGCVGSDEVTVTVLEDHKMIAMNVLTPNQDGINDTWKVINSENYESVNVEVIDRWGNTVFSEHGYQNDWNGYRGNDVLPDGTYYYFVSFDDSEVVYKGVLTILRDR